MLTIIAPCLEDPKSSKEELGQSGKKGNSYHQKDAISFTWSPVSVVDFPLTVDHSSKIIRELALSTRIFAGSIGQRKW